MTATLVIRMRVCDDMGGEFPALEQPQELPSGEPATRVDQGLTTDVGVQYVGAHERHPPDVSRDLVDGHAPNQSHPISRSQRFGSSVKPWSSAQSQ